MKNIGIILFALTILGSANPLNVCSQEHSIRNKNKCIKNKINEMLAENGEKLVVSNIVLAERKNLFKRDDVLIVVARSKHERKCKRIHIALDKELRKYGGLLRSLLLSKDTQGFCSVRATGHLTHQELQYFMKKHPKAKRIQRQDYSSKNNYYIVPSSISTASHYNQTKMISSNVNGMCIQLKKNYDKFNNSNVEPRTLERIEREYNECLRDQKELIDFQRN